MIGETISHYRILHQLGGGGMGVVYAAELRVNSRLLASGGGAARGQRRGK